VTGTDELDTIAAQWIVRREKAGWTDEDQTEFENWLAATAGNRIAYLRLADVWNRAGRLKALDQPARRRFFVFRRNDSLKPLARVAALFILAAAIGAAGYAWLSRSSDTRYATGIGEREIITLADGSRIELNTQTVLRLSRDGGARRVTLDSGQAYFDIKHDPAHPFVVLTADHRITDIGTKFEVRASTRQVRVTLFEGSAQFESLSPNAAKQNAILKPGDVAVATAASMRIVRQPTKKLMAEIGWRHGVIVFDHTTLADAAAEFNRYNRKKLVVTDPKVAKLTIGGTFQTTNTQQLTQLARDIFGLTIEDRGTDIVISR
jgi:transmembrane sensor